MARPPFIKNFDYRGTWAYSLTCCTFRRFRHFSNSQGAQLVIDQLERTAEEREFELLVYCVMPDHVHALVQGRTARSELRSFVRLWRQRTGMQHAARGRASSRDGATQVAPSWHPLWQKGYFERVIRSHEDLDDVAAYIIANPVRAGLVTSVDQWPWIGGRLVRRAPRKEGATEVAPSYSPRNKSSAMRMIR